MARFFGTPDGIRTGQQFESRRDLFDAHVHRQLQAGIAGTASEGADSIIVSGGYVDDEDHGDYILYTGHGGNDPSTRKQIADQSVDAPGNAALITSETLGLPVRVTRGAHKGSPYAPPAGFRYAGLYEVSNHWTQVGRNGFLIVRFRLDRLPEQSPLDTNEPPDLDPAFATTTVSRRIRDSAVAREVKGLYDHTCQICGIQIVGFENRLYSEGAHVRPLGRPHLGADRLSNLLCLCPNHHTRLDIGGILIQEDMTVTEVLKPGAFAELTFKGAHRLDAGNADYHRRMWTATI